MASIDLIRASDGSGNASAATVQSIRSSGATTLDVDTVQGIPDTFYATMGTPHTFTDPVTSETITVISEATAVDFAGHVDGSNLEIDTIAPGYTDNGSAVGDIIIIRPTTQWSDNVADVLAVSHNDDGTLKAVTENPGWTALAYTPNTVTANGNRSYSLVFNSVDLTSAISPGMRIRTTRTVTAPTQCTSLNGSSQYYSKASPNKLTFTDDFVVSAWVKLTSYATTSCIASRSDGTSGWGLFITTSGQLQLVGYNGALGNQSQVISYQSVPLNKWVHVTAQLDMSSFTATSTTSYTMIDGVDVPASVTRGGTNPIALVQAGNLNIGNFNAGAFYFQGKLAQVAIYNAKVTQATIRTLMSQTLTGSETSLASAYSFNNSIADLNTSTPNDLTANGSAVATNADSPFSIDSFGLTAGTTDYAIVTKSSFSTNTTLVVQVPEANTIPTSGGVSAVSYSVQKAPYGMPIQKEKWVVSHESVGLINGAFGGTGTWTAFTGNAGKLTVPIGNWVVGYKGIFALGSTVAGQRTGHFTLESAAPTTVYNVLNTRVYQGASASTAIFPMSKNTEVSLSTATTYQAYAYIYSATGSESFDMNGTQGTNVIYAELAYL